MATSFEVQKAKVKMLSKELYEIRHREGELKLELQQETAVFQELCGIETGHDYVAEPDGDYHKPSYNYICHTCNHFTKMRPQKYRWEP
jgi:hypothetical protein